RDAVVAFQADDVDPVTLTGWSVTVTGTARLVVTPDEVTRLRTMLQPWVRVTDGHYVRIPAGHVAGSRFGGPPRGIFLASMSPELRHLRYFVAVAAGPPAHAGYVPPGWVYA